MHTYEFRVPDEHELVEFFGSEPIGRSVEDGYWCYEIAGASGMTMQFSLNLYERSVQTELRIGVSSITKTSHEMATQLAINGRQLQCEFLCDNCHTTLTIDAAQGYRAVWSTLRTKEVEKCFWNYPVTRHACSLAGCVPSTRPSRRHSKTKRNSVSCGASRRCWNQRSSGLSMPSTMSCALLHEPE